MSTAESSPRLRLSRASSNAAGRSRLPTWSARNGGVSVAVVISPPGRVARERISTIERRGRKGRKERRYCGVVRRTRSWQTTISVQSACRFPPQAERLLGGPIGEAEEHGVAAGAVRHRLPRRHDEDVVRAPRDCLIADAAAAVSLGHTEHGGIGRAGHLSLE